MEWRCPAEFESAVALDEEAIAHFDQVLAVETSGEYYEGSLGGKGMCLAQLGRIDEAIATFEEALKIAEPFYEHHRQLALC